VTSPRHPEGWPSAEWRSTQGQSSNGSPWYPSDWGWGQSTKLLEFDGDFASFFLTKNAIECVLPEEGRIFVTEHPEPIFEVPAEVLVAVSARQTRGGVTISTTPVLVPYWGVSIPVSSGRVSVQLLNGETAEKIVYCGVAFGRQTRWQSAHETVGLPPATTIPLHGPGPVIPAFADLVHIVCLQGSLVFPSVVLGPGDSITLPAREWLITSGPAVTSVTWWWESAW